VGFEGSVPAVNLLDARPTSSKLNVLFDASMFPSGEAAWDGVETEKSIDPSPSLC
jgi:hypothetical protein